MSLVTLRGPSKGVTVDLAAEVTFSATHSGQHGQASFLIPRHSRAWDTDIISEEGGFAVEIPSRYGLWRGLADTPQWTPRGMRITAWHINRWAEMRLVSPNRTFYSMPAGVIFRHAVRDAFTGVIPVTIAEALCAPPLVPIYEFRRQTLMDVLRDLSEQTGQTWWIDANGRIHWAYRQGRFRERWLVDDGGLLGQWQDPPLIEGATEIIEVDKAGREWSITDRTTPLSWPVQRTVRVGDDRR